jgi:YD repeat-containing protein
MVNAVNLLRGKPEAEQGNTRPDSGSPGSQKYRAERGAFSEWNPFVANALAPVRPEPAFATPTWSSLVAAMLDPLNATGATDPLSRNFHWSLGLAGLPGRAGLNAGLTLNYNSLIWTKDPTSDVVAFDLDRGFPTPGFRLGFPVIYGMHTNATAGVYAYLMLAPDGGRIELRQIGSTSVYESADSSHVQLADLGSGSLLVRTTDGTRLSYTSTTNGYRCTQIKDRNGNYLTIGNDSAGRLQTVTDTLGRVFTVNYDENNNPISITQTRGEAEYTWATFGYEDFELETDFGELGEIGTDFKTIPVLSQVGLPDGSYYTFDYNHYAQVTRVNYYAADDHLLNYLGNDLSAANSAAQSDCPRISKINVLADNWNLDGSFDPQEVTTKFSAPAVVACDGYSLGTDCLETVVTAPAVAPMPDGTEQRTFYKGPGNWDFGLPVLEETWAEDDSSPSTLVKQRWVTTTWDQDNTSVAYPLNPRVTETNIFDSGNQKRTAIHYETLAVGCGTSCSTDINLPDAVTEYDSDATTVLRTTETDYLETTAYLDRRIIGLPVEKRIYAGTNAGTLMAKTGFYYDDPDFLTAQGSSIPQFDATNYGSTFYYRGNLWKVRQYQIGTSNFKDSKIGYNTTGAVILTRDPLNHDHTIEYSATYELAYPTKVTDPDGNHGDVEYNFVTGQKTHVYGPALSSGSPGHPGSESSFIYDTIGRLYSVTNEANDANTIYAYATTGTNVTSYTTIKDLSTYTVASTITDGAGRTIATATEHPGSGGTYKAQTERYDILGRPVETSNATEINGVFLPDGDDYTAGWQYTEQTYDWKGRPLVTTHPDSTTSTAGYSGCGCAGGEVVTLQDEGTMIGSTLTRRKQKIYSDVLGRMVKAETFNWDGATAYSTLTNEYNVLDQVILTTTYAGSTSSSTIQQSSVEYDGYGRIYRTHAPEQFTIGLSSSEVPTYTTFTYNADDTRATITDGRGASTAFTYNNRRLVTQVDYAVSGGSITVPDDTVFTYDGAGNRTSMTDGSGNTDYVYDQQSRLSEETRYFDLTLAAAPESGNGFKLEYTYGLDGSLATLTDPFSHTFTYARDNLGRLTGVTGTSFAGVTTYASNAGYRAWDAPKALNYGNGLSMSMTFNERQQAATFEVGKTGSTLIQKSYQYYNDGNLKFSDDALDAKFDRLQKYDSVGRIEEAFSGARARGETLDDYANQPYQESYGYNAFDQITSRENRHWVAEYGTSDSYDRNHRAGCDYDADGRLTRMGSTTDGDEVSYLIDAAGQIEQDTATAQDRSNMSYDGDGQMTVQTKYHWLTATSVFNTVPTSDNLFIRSSVLNGTVVSEALGASSGSDAGKMWRTHIPAGGTELAQLIKGGGFLSDAVYWPITDPAQESYRLTDTSGNIAGSYLFLESAKEMDPAGADVKPWNPYDTINPPLEGFPDSSTLTPFAASPAFPRVTVSFNGIPISRDQLNFFLESGHLGGQLGLLELSLRPKFISWGVAAGENSRLVSGTLSGGERSARILARELYGIPVRMWLESAWTFSVNLFPPAAESGQQGQRTDQSRPRTVVIRSRLVVPNPKGNRFIADLNTFLANHPSCASALAMVGAALKKGSYYRRMEITDIYDGTDPAVYNRPGYNPSEPDVSMRDVDEEMARRHTGRRWGETTASGIYLFPPAVRSAHSFIGAVMFHESLHEYGFGAGDPAGSHWGIVRQLANLGLIAMPDKSDSDEQVSGKLSDWILQGCPKPTQ